jgi:group I intron endonuclease
MKKIEMIIYGLFSSESPSNIRYIGKATNIKDRLRRHLSKYSLKNDTYKNRWIKSEINKGNKIEIAIIEEVSESNWEKAEIFWISEFRKLGYNLTNSTIGGDGIVPTNEIINKRGKTKITNNLKNKSELIEKFNIREINNMWVGERVCPKCGKIITYELSNINKLISLCKKSIDRKCLSCSSIDKTPFRNHKWSTKGMKYKTNNSKLIREKYGKKIQQFDRDGNLIDEFNSIREASSITKIDRKSISQCIKGTRITAGGYIFKQKMNNYEK